MSRNVICLAAAKESVSLDFSKFEVVEKNVATGIDALPVADLRLSYTNFNGIRTKVYFYDFVNSANNYMFYMSYYSNFCYKNGTMSKTPNAEKFSRCRHVLCCEIDNAQDMIDLYQDCFNLQDYLEHYPNKRGKRAASDKSSVKSKKKRSEEEEEDEEETSRRGIG